MRPVPGWTLITAGTAPILLVGGWTVAALLLGSGYDPATDTISVLASVGEPYRWLMTAAIAGLGVCHVATAVGLRAAPLVGRIALAGAGGSAIVLALTPEPHDGASFQHGTVVAVGFSLMALWPALAARRGPAAPWVLRPRTVLLVTLLVLAGAAWFLLELRDHGLVGVAERALCAIQSLWPLVVVASCRRRLAAGLVEWRGVLGERVGHASAPPDEGRIRT
ncbi:MULTISPECIES: DUF998 domain-containing protein [Streptacidiphilus]|uniref:DUF998 domain-containing protein n=1 Tax=Streptacidiphilus cavernicola TaxID=3342716 RepID=A0ABV6UVI7_9ACTN|nr:DUF998 domain-containing protein [Streptacidiphilus jeojiense]